MNNPKKIIGNYLKTTREKNNISFEKIQLLTDIPIREYKKYEDGKLPIDKQTLKDLSKAMPIPTKYKKLADDPKKSTLANRITQLRITNNKTQEETAKKLEIAQTTYAGYETGRHEPDVKMLLKIAELYSVSVDYVIGRF